jgi:S-adenosylmethionine-dependent methyltransferase
VGTRGDGAAPHPLRELVRLEVVARQLARHLPTPPARVLDVGSGGAVHALRLARAGLDVLLVEPDPRLRAAALGARDREAEPVRSRLEVREGSLGALADAVGDRQFDAVTCHRALAACAEPREAVVELSDLVAAGGVVSLVAPSADGMALPPAAQGRWADALDLLAAAADPHPIFAYDGGDGGDGVRGYHLEELASFIAGRRMHVEAWYGVGLLTGARDADEPAPVDGDERAAVLAAEELAGRTDPYRRVAPLLHVVGRRAVSRSS